jgi:5-methylcytosine-specific restriction endonuclease McrA
MSPPRLNSKVHEAALATLRSAVEAFAAGDIARGDRLVADLDTEAIEGDRARLREIARAARLITDPGVPNRPRRDPAPAVKAAVARRDHYTCRYTGRQLVDTQVFRELGRVSTVFHFDEHHSVRPTRRGPGGHPIIRTHGAAYDHVTPHSHGGEPTAFNLILTSVQLNEAKGTKALEIVDVAETPWNGLSEYLPRLARQPSARVTNTRAASVHESAGDGPAIRSLARTPPTRTRQHELTTVPSTEFEVYAYDADPTCEEAFRQLRSVNKNSFFATRRLDGTWMTHRLYCSSLDFSVPRLLTASPKICAPHLEAILSWAERVGVALTACKRCSRAK